jgi:histidinol dehydrogenase
MKRYTQPAPSTWSKILARPVMDTSSLDDVVLQILNAVQKDGDKALLTFTEKFDKVKIDSVAVNDDEFKEADQLLSPDLKEAIQVAKTNIERFHSQQKEAVQRVETMPGVVCWRKSVGIERVGLYVPGGTAPLLSSVLMLGVPAKLAGCSEVILCTPPQKNGKVYPAVLYAAQQVGINKVFKVGGAQAIGAMTYGTDSIPSVYKIFGPGNQYVTAAKQLVSRQGVAIDMPAGPSEVLVYADDSAHPDFVAADLLSQAEHGTDSQVVLVTNSESFVQRVEQAIEQQLPLLPRKEIAKGALANSLAIVLADTTEAIRLINAYAPEHLILACDNPEKMGASIINAGSVFLGHYTPRISR